MDEEKLTYNGVDIVGIYVSGISIDRTPIGIREKLHVSDMIIESIFRPESMGIVNPDIIVDKE